MRAPPCGPPGAWPSGRWRPTRLLRNSWRSPASRWRRGARGLTGVPGDGTRSCWAGCRESGTDPTFPMFYAFETRGTSGLSPGLLLVNGDVPAQVVGGGFLHGAGDGGHVGGHVMLEAVLAEIG